MLGHCALTLLFAAGACASPLAPRERVANADAQLGDGTVLQVVATAQAAKAAAALSVSVWKRMLQTPNASDSKLLLDLQVPFANVAAVKAIDGLAVQGVMHEDLAAVVAQQAANRTRSWDRHASINGKMGASVDPFFDEYRTHEEIVEFMQLLTQRYADITTFTPSIGSSVEGAAIPAITIGGTEGGPTIMNQCGLHAREWITHSTCMYIVVELLESEDPEVRRLVDQVRFVFVPDANPDGYKHSWTAGGRMWRKNRAVNSGSTCRGVDLNRNFDDHWNFGGGCSSTNPCSETFHGPIAASEAETQASQRFLTSQVAAHTVLGALDWHSYTQLILRPYGWQSPAVGVPANDAFATRVGDAMSDAIFAIHGMRYTNQPTMSLYPACGICGDYMGTVTQGVALTMELRPLTPGGGGFVLPDSQIVPTGEENMAGFISYARDLMTAHVATLA